jgi:hypothetical protein
VNVLAPYLLTSILVPLVTDHIINVSSISASSSLEFGNLQQERGYRWAERQAIQWNARWPIM